MKIRAANIDDLKQLTQLFDAYRVFYKKATELTAAKIFLEERLINKDSEIFVCENGELQLLGFVQLYPLFSSVRMKKLWILNDLYVDKQHRGKGLSKMLIEKAKELVKLTDACGMFLETGKTNSIGNQLYPKMGFTLNDDANYYEWYVGK